MKYYQFFVLGLFILVSCQKSKEDDPLLAMKTKLSKSWRISSIYALEPQSWAGIRLTGGCADLNIWTFGEGGQFRLTEDSSCYNYPSEYLGIWKFVNKDSLVIEYTRGSSSDRNFRIAKLTDDTLKLQMPTIILDSLYTPGVNEYTFIPK
jgi:hypothetical protein